MEEGDNAESALKTQKHFLNTTPPREIRQQGSGNSDQNGCFS